MFIQTETTPNPSTLKFLPGRPVMESGTLDIRAAEGANQSPLAEALFALDGVSGVFFGSNFISVTNTGADWQELKPTVLGAIMEAFPFPARRCWTQEAVAAGGGDVAEFFAADDAETVATIKQLIETHVPGRRRRRRRHIKFRGYRDGTVFLAMKGSCSGCPSSTATLKHGIQNLLKHYVPDVRAVEQI